MQPPVLEQLRIPYHYTEGEQHIHDCPFCGKQKHLFVRVDESDGEYYWDCKVCGKMGTLRNFLEFYWIALKQRQDDNPKTEKYFNALSQNRSIKVKTLIAAGLVWDKDRWLIPIRDENNTIVTFRFYTPGVPSKALKKVRTSLYNLHKLKTIEPNQQVFICEGEWDALKMQEYFDDNGIKAIALGVPGATAKITRWGKFFTNRPVAVVYDNDIPGSQGMQKVCLILKDFAKHLQYINWPKELPDGFDIRDFFINNGTMEVLHELLKVWKGEISSADEEKVELKEFTDRDSFDEVVQIYEKHMHMTDDMRQTLKVAFATIYSNQIKGDPLWVHIVGPAGSGKTMLLMSTSEVADVYAVSTLTPHSLISGFALPGGADPSLVPKLLGKTLIVKDFTEVVQMPRIQKDEVYAVLRGAYDGEIHRIFGNGTERKYKGHFSMLTGVTSAVYMDQLNSTLGERFLMFSMNKSEISDVEDIIYSAISGSGNEAEMRKEIMDAAKSFLQVKLPVENADIPIEIKKKIISLAQFVSALRAQVAKNEYKNTLLYRPQNEVGTRLAKQFMKLAYGLYFVNGQKFDKDDWQILQKVAIDTCIGFHLEVVAYVMANDEEGCSVEEIVNQISLPTTTAREVIGDLETLGILEKELGEQEGPGRRRIFYYVSDEIRGYWNKAELKNAKQFIYRTHKRKRRSKVSAE